MSAFNLLNITPKFSTCTMYIMFTDKLFRGFGTIYSTFTGLCYGQETLEYPALLIPLECCTRNISAADISCKVISLELKGYTWTEWQFHVAQTMLTVTPTISSPLITYPFLGSLALSCNSHRLYSYYISHHLQQDIGAIPCNTYSCPCTRSFHCLKNVCSATITNSSRTFPIKETSFPLSSVNINASDGGLEHIILCRNPQRSSGYR
jgi:hypothetical protein